MAATQTKKTVMAIVAEVTEGTPVAPSSGADYIAVQDGFDIDPSFDELENSEFTGSIGGSKSILGFENPSLSLNHYIRHSGVEGVEPDMSLLLEASFGSKVIASSEFNTIAGSTAGSSTAAAVIKVDTGEGASFERGQALLIKDAANGYSIRNVLSVATDDLTLGFNLASAPAVGVNLGKALLYKPSESHPSLSIHNYRGNGTVKELISGARITEMGMEVNAGELINGSFSMGGVKYFFNPIVIDATNNKIDFSDDAIPTELNATIASGTYKDPHELAAAIATVMTAASANTITVTYSDTTGKFTISSSGATFELLWSTGTNTATSVGTTIGFAVAADDVSATTYTSDNALDFSSPFAGALDDSDPLVAKANEVFLGDFADNVCFPAYTMNMTMANTKTDVTSICADTGKDSSLITKREVSIEISATLDKYDVDKFKRFRANEETSFAFNFGTKSGGNWIAGKSANLYLPTSTISAFKVSDNDGLISLDITLKAFVSAGAGEAYLNLI